MPEQSREPAAATSCTLCQKKFGFFDRGRPLLANRRYCRKCFPAEVLRIRDEAFAAVAANDRATVSRLLSEGLSVDLRKEELRAGGWDCRTLLWEAVSSGHLDMCRFLLEKGSTVNFSYKFDLHGREQSTSLLYGAAAAQNPSAFEIFRLLQTKGGDLRPKGPFNNSLLHGAAIANNPRLGALLIAGGIDVNECNEDRETPLHKAAQWGHAEMVRLLLAEGADATIVSKHNGWTPLDYAKCHSDQAVISLLESALLRKVRTDRHNGIRPLGQ